MSPDEELSNAPRTVPPVTVLCGFLGAGKTTLLNHLLSQAEGRRWAAVVNDVASINIDAAVVQTTAGSAGDVVELGNGCVCCSSRDQLAETVAELAASGNYEHILVETTGVAEPRGIAALFLQRNPFGRSLSDFARLSCLVSVVDAAHFLREWRDYQAKDGKRAVPAGGSRPVFELMLEQVECADVIVLNKADLLDPADKPELERVVRGLNARAEQLWTERSQVPVEFLLDRPRFDPERTLASATWIRTLNELLPTGRAPLRKADREGQGSLVERPRAAAMHRDRFGIDSFVFQARRPFVRARLEALLAGGLPGLLRAKGFFWIQEQPDEMGFLSVAGGVVRYDFLNYWWAALVESGKAKRADVPSRLEPLWEEPAGDRRQELVFIGIRLDEPRARAQLEACLADPAP